MNAGRRLRLPHVSIRPGQTVGASSRGTLLHIAGLTALALVLAACGPRPVGDFGRPRPSFTHDVDMPAQGQNKAAERGEPVSDFNITDQEEEMHDRVWRFLVAAHARDWDFDKAVELQRTRIRPPTDQTFTIERYYNWLKTTPYESSRTRYATVGRHITADLDTVPDTFAAICAVIEVDRQRDIAYQGLAHKLPPDTAQQLQARKYENDAFIAWFVRALSYRYSSYDFALDNLLVETPHEQSLAVDEALRRMAVYVDRAKRHDFCGGGTGSGGGIGAIIPSRYSKVVDQEVILPK
jgi:hypothetical protein